MNVELVNFEDLSDSREMLEAKEPNFIVFFIYLLLVIIITTFIWMWFGEIDITVRANGILRPGESISVIRNINGGEIEKLFYYENKNVNKGELLYVVDSSNLELQLDKFVKERDRLTSEVENLKILEKSIKQENNFFKEGNIEFYNRYLVYKYEKERLLLDYTQARSKYTREEQLSPSFTAANRLEELKTAYSIARINYERFFSETLVSIKKETESNEVSLMDVESQIMDLQNKIDLNSVKAPINGSVQVYYEFNIGDYIPSGIEVMRIIPDQGKNDYKVEVVVENKDISHLKIGQKVKFRILALPYKEYGTLDGKIIKISRDTISGENKANMSYLIEADINGIQLYDKDNNPARIKPGMICESRIVVRQKKILYYVLEKLDFIS
jgi:membrane fusion protein, peptide pheromone/bacteriocin exporter